MQKIGEEPEKPSHPNRYVRIKFGGHIQYNCYVGVSFVLIVMNSKLSIKSFWHEHLEYKILKR